MKLRYRTSAKPVSFSINIGGAECSDMTSLRQNFLASDFLQYLKNGDARMEKWLKRNGKDALVDDFKNAADQCAVNKGDSKRIDEGTYLALLKIFFDDDFAEAGELLDALDIWQNKKGCSPETNRSLKYLIDYLCEDEELCRKVCERFESKVSVGKYFDLCKEKKSYDKCISLFWKYNEKQPEWVDCEKVFDVVSDLYWESKKPEHLFLIAKLLIEKFPKGDNQKIGVSCLMKAVEQKNDKSIAYLKSDGPHKKLICQSYEGCKVYFENNKGKESFDLYFDFCMRRIRKTWAKEDYEKCVQLKNDNEKWADEDKLFDISSDMFWKNQNPQALYEVALLLKNKKPNEEKKRVADECMKYAAEQLNYQPAVDYLKSTKINLEKESSKSNVR